MNDGMAGFVIGNHFPLGFFQNHGFAFRAEAHFVARGFEVRQRNCVAVLLGGNNGGFVDEIR